MNKFIKLNTALLIGTLKNLNHDIHFKFDTVDITDIRININDINNIYYRLSEYKQSVYIVLHFKGLYFLHKDFINLIQSIRDTNGYEMAIFNNIISIRKNINELPLIPSILEFISKTIKNVLKISKYSLYFCTPKSFSDKILSNLAIKLNKSSKISYKSFAIGRNSIINGSIHAKGGKILLGQFITGGYGIEFIAGNHNISLPNLQITLQREICKEIKFNDYTDKGIICIGNNVWIGDNAMILSNVTIGDGAIIGTGSVVTHDVPPFAIVAGVPAKILRYRFTNAVINQLNTIKWWYWSMKKILINKKFFTTQIPQDKNIDLYNLLVE